MSQTADLIINALWIVTIDSEARKLKDHALIIRDQKIIAIAPIDQHPFTAQQVIERRQHILMPGLINAHTHAAMSLLRGLADDLPLMAWLNDHIWPAESRWGNADFVKDGAELALAEMIRSGTTCFNDMYFFPTMTAKVARQAKLRACLAFPVLEFPSAWAQTADDYLHKGLQLCDDYRNNDLINISFGPHAPYTVSDAALRRIATIAPETQTGVHIHLHETAHEVQESLQQHQQRPIERLQQLNLLNPQLQAVHMTQAEDSDIELLANNGCHVIHCPESNLKLASGFCPTAQLLQAGINVALGTDGAASNNDLDMFSELRTAALLAKGVAQDPTVLDADTALAMATINGAKALGIDDITGSLEIGKMADCICVAVNQPESLPCYDLAALLVYSTSADKVTDSWVAGQAIMENRKLLTLNADSIIARAQQWQEKIAKTDAQPTE